MSKQNIYLVAFYYAKPKPGVQTQVAGWNKDPNNIQYDERVEITRGLKKDTYAAGVILNLSKKTVERNRHGDNNSFDEMFKYFFKGYNKSVFVRTVLTIIEKKKGFKFSEFIYKVKLRPTSLVLCGDKKSYSALIEDIYNYERRENEKLNLRLQ